MMGILSGFDVGKITGTIDEGAFGNTAKSLESAGNSIVYILMMVVGFAVVIGLLITVLMILVGGSVQKTVAKGNLLWILVAGIIGFGALGIVGLVQSVGQKLFKDSGSGYNNQGIDHLSQPVVVAYADDEIAEHFLG